MPSPSIKPQTWMAATNLLRGFRNLSRPATRKRRRDVEPTPEPRYANTWLVKETRQSK